MECFIEQEKNFHWVYLQNFFFLCALANFFDRTPLTNFTFAECYQIFSHFLKHFTALSTINQPVFVPLSSSPVHTMDLIFIAVWQCTYTCISPTLPNSLFESSPIENPHAAFTFHSHMNENPHQYRSSFLAVFKS